MQAESLPSNSTSETQDSHSLLFGLIFFGILTAWGVKFNFFGVTSSQALKLIYYRLPHYQNQLRIEDLEAQLRLVEDKLPTQQQIKERVDSLFANHLEDVQQLQNQIKNIKGKAVVLQSESKNNQDVIESINENIKLLFDAFDGLEREFINIKTKVDILGREVNNCENNIASFYNNYREPQTIHEAEASTKSKFNTVSEVLLKAKQEFSILKIFDLAKNSASEASYRNYK